MKSSMLADIVKSGVKLTPMMDQYYNIKKNYPDIILFFRMGDFYEVFFEDAVETSKRLNITLTHRGKINEIPIPMAGIPHHAAPNYVDRLTSQGLKVAICEQTQNPKDAVGIVTRAVAQVASPSMPYDMDKSEEKAQYFMASAIASGEEFYLAAIDFTTGEFFGKVFNDEKKFLNGIQLIAPREFVTYMGQWDNFPEIKNLLSSENDKILVTHLSEEYFDSKNTEIYSQKFIPGLKRDKIINQKKDICSPIGALTYYISSTQTLNKKNGEPVHIRPFKLISSDEFLQITLSTLTGIEVFPRNRDNYKQSLIGFFDRTGTSMGARKLKSYFRSPLMNLDQIQARQQMIEFLLKDQELLSKLREDYAQIRDLDRILAKVSTGKTTASDLINLANATDLFLSSFKSLKSTPKNVVPKLSKEEETQLIELSKLIQSSINDEIGASLDKGNLIRPGQYKKRDRLAKLNQTASNELVILEEKYRAKTGIQKLRVKHNNVAGFFIEISKSHTSKVPKSFDRKQTLTNSERYTTNELKEFEKEVLSAKSKLEQLERKIFQDIVEQLAIHNELIHKLSDSIATIDVFTSLTWVTIQENLSKPLFDTKKTVLDIKGGWHPLIKNSIKENFVAHDLKLDQDIPFGLITGPNMAGKTTVMRETAIIQILAQMGSFVPAEYARLGICDHIFSRLGASDDILRGQSTFMVEMSETAEILRHATHRSLIILDEVGRGTSTYDGLSIAWALVEHLTSQTKALTLFATHYHELIEVVNGIKTAKNFTVETISKGDEVQFLYRLLEKGASESFGIYVAKLAGVPKSLLMRSQEILNGLEDNKNTSIASSTIETKNSVQLSFFESDSHKIEVVPERLEHLEKLEDELEAIDIQRLTPLDALNKLNELKDNMLQ